MGITAGTLYLVATPIGHLGDMTFRAVEVLQSVALIAAEDTRHSKVLLNHYAINTPLVSLHQHNEDQRTRSLITRLTQGDDVALISDAGTPLISDPGYRMVRGARDHAIAVVPIPGACAAIVALSASGLATNQFIFEGFLPAKALQRIERLKAFCDEKRTVVFYEAPHRVVALMQDVVTVFGPDRHVVIARELTKQFETIHEASAQAMYDWLLNDSNQQKGEFVVMLQGAVPNDKGLSDEAARTLDVLQKELPLKQAVSLAAKITGEKKNRLYELALNKR